MKTILITLMFLSLCVGCFAQDFSTINEESINAFIKLLPEYKVLVQKFSNKDNPAGAAQEVSNYANEVQSLFSRYGMTMEQFPPFIQRVNLGFATIQMEKNGMGDQMGGLIESIKSQLGDNTLTDEEMAVLKAHEEEIQSVFNEGAE